MNDFDWRNKPRRLPNDYSRCTGNTCEQASQCLRYTDKGTGDRISTHDAVYGCIGFIPNNLTKESTA